ncbi:Hypothetical protein NTJ_00064 [Nesidiocoris tenuis]|uniref:Gustatory receptor n=1 Tax=Nesidiocoris tenuis TaxID=355587 RepID=A0ABN7A7R0_9HEMI|nr:Hypothetical protein NTJ_00064 [Nesidiocoris tenuis]
MALKGSFTYTTKRPWVLEYLRRNLLISRFLGVFPFSVDDEFSISKFELAGTLIFNVFFSAVAVITIANEFTSHHASIQDLQLALISGGEAALMGFLVCLSSFEILRNAKQFKTIYRHFRKVDMYLERISAKKRPPLSDRELMLRVLHLWPIFIIIMIEIERYTALGHTYDLLRYLSIIAHVTCNVKLFGIAFSFKAFMCTLGVYIETLNDALSAKSATGSANSLIYISGEAHDHLYLAFKCINAAFARTLLVMVINCFVKCTDNFYKLIGQEEGAYSSFLFAIWMSTMIMQLLILTNAVIEPVEQVNLKKL